jgi:hypothetical protein
MQCFCANFVSTCRDDSVGIATVYVLDDRGVRVRVQFRGKIFLFSKSSSLALGSTQLPIKEVPGAISPGGKAAGT